MDNTEYLNQISSTVRPAKKSRMNFMSSPIFKVVAGGILVFVLIFVIGSFISGGRADVRQQTVSLKLRIDSTLSVISEYQNKIKSSNLRSSSASLYSVLSNTDRELSNVIESNNSYKNLTKNSNLTEEAELHTEELSTDLFEAKINGILDRIYAQKMAYEISFITAKETSIYNSSSDEEIQRILSTSYSSLNNLYDAFNNFSEN